MSVNIGVSVTPTTRPNWSRSQLVTNRFLIALGQAFGRKEFTSRDVTGKFGLDFLNTAKLLSRMSRKPYYLLSVRKIARQVGGYENVYSIAHKGWGKIAHLQRHPARTHKSSRDSRQENWATQYLLTGKGEAIELLQNSYFQTDIAPLLSPLNPNPPMDEEGLFLCLLDSGYVPVEVLGGLEDGPSRTMLRARYLQGQGLIPSDIDVDLFVLNAYERGSSDPAILISLLTRGGIKLRNELLEMEMLNHMGELISLVKEKVTAQRTTSTTAPTECENCRRKTELFELEKRYTESCQKLYTESCENKINSLRNERDDSRLDYLKLNSRVDRLENHIVNMSQAMGLVSDSLEKFNDPSPCVDLVKAHIGFALAGIVHMNINACSRTS